MWCGHTSQVSGQDSDGRSWHELLSGHAARTGRHAGSARLPTDGSARGHRGRSSYESDRDGPLPGYIFTVKLMAGWQVDARSGLPAALRPTPPPTPSSITASRSPAEPDPPKNTAATTGRRPRACRARSSGRLRCGPSKVELWGPCNQDGHVSGRLGWASSFCGSSRTMYHWRSTVGFGLCSAWSSCRGRRCCTSSWRRQQVASPSGAGYSSPLACFRTSPVTRRHTPAVTKQLRMSSGCESGRQDGYAANSRRPRRCDCRAGQLVDAIRDRAARCHTVAACDEWRGHRRPGPAVTLRRFVGRLWSSRRSISGLFETPALCARRTPPSPGACTARAVRSSVALVVRRA